MSSVVDLGEFRSAYIAEVEELAAAAGQVLVVIEQASRAGHASARHLRDLARALHTIKGLSAMVGVEPVVAIAHRMESTVRPLERTHRPVDDATLEALLAGMRAIDARIAEVVAGKGVSSPPEAVLRGLCGEGEEIEHPRRRVALPVDPAVSSKLRPDEIDRLVDLAPGERAVALTFRPSPPKSAAGIGINEVRERIGRVAEIVRVVPRSVTVSPEAPGGLAFLLLVVTRETDEALLAAGGDPEIELQALATMSAPPAAPVEEPAEELPLLPAEPRRAGMLRVEVSRVDDALEKLSEMVVTRARLALSVSSLAANGVDVRELRAILQDSTRQIRELRASMLRVRMVALSEVLERLPLIVRDLRRTTGKRVRLEVATSGAELDKTVAERLLPVFVHLIRNAVDHGIEQPDERERLGKPTEAAIRISAAMHTSRRIELRVSDDGRGIDVEAIARRAGRTNRLEADEVLDVLCTPGFSTRDVVTTTSGRGMGMEIVRKVAVSELGGELFVETELGKGTTFVIRVPLTIAVVDALTVRCAGQRFAVPVPAVEEIVEIGAGDIVEPPRSRGRDVRILRRRGEALPLVDLAARLRLGGESVVHQAIVVRRGRESIAFGLDRVLGQQEAVVRPLDDLLVQVPGISGSTDLGDGRPTLVVDLVALGALVAGEENAA